MPKGHIMYAKSMAALITLLSITAYPSLARPYELDGYMLLEGLRTFNGGLGSGSVYNAVLNPIVNYNFTQDPYQSGIRLGILAIGDSNNTFQYTNAFQNISNMSAQREIRLSECNYFRDLYNTTNIRIGIMDIRNYINSYDIPKELFNSGFGTNRVMNNGTNVSTYPYSGFGALLQYSQQNYGLQAAVFQGNPKELSSILRDGALFIEQLNVNFNINSKNQRAFYLKIGAWQNYQPNADIGFSNIGAYVMGQYAWMTARSQQMSIFSQIGYSNKQANTLPFSFAIGITSVGLLPERNKDHAAFGMTSICLRHLKPEIIFELTYAIYIIRNFYLNPDVQYIIKPRGALANSWAGVLRLTYNFDGHLLERH